MIRDYYKPFIQAVDNYLIHWETTSDITPPDSISYLMAYNTDNPDQVYLTWSPEFDTNFKSTEIQFDLDSISINSPIIDFNDYSSLQYMRLNNQTIIGLNNSESWFFRVRATDHFDNTGLREDPIFAREAAAAKLSSPGPSAYSSGVSSP